MEEIEKVLSLSRQSLVGVAVLSGCDYLPKGVPGCGKALLCKLINHLRGQSILQRLLLLLFPLFSL